MNAVLNIKCGFETAANFYFVVLQWRSKPAKRRKQERQRKLLMRKYRIQLLIGFSYFN